MKRMVRIFNLAMLLVFISTANAALIQTDLVPDSGDGLLTLDTDTKLEWLDLTETANLSYNEVSGGAGGYTTTLGFRYATHEEVTDLYITAGVTEFGLVQLPSNIPAAELLLDLMGCLEVCSGTLFGANGRTSTSFAPNTHSSPFFQLNTAVGARFWIEPNGINDDSSSPFQGNYLVREAVLDGPPLLTVFPNSGGNTGLVTLTVTIRGDVFLDGASVALESVGFPSIEGEPVEVEEQGGNLVTTFNLTGQPLGLWDVVVTNPDGTVVTLPQGFTIEEGRVEEPWIDIIGLSNIRVGREQSYAIFVGNPSNINIPVAHVFLNVGQGASVQVDNFGELAVLPEDSQIHASILDIAPGEVISIPIKILANGVSGLIDMIAGVTPDLSRCADLRSRVKNDAPVIPGTEPPIPPKDFNDYVSKYPASVPTCKAAPAGYLCTFYHYKPLSILGRVRTGWQQGMSMGDGSVRWSYGYGVQGTETVAYDKIFLDPDSVYTPGEVTIEDKGADRPYYGFGLDTEGNTVPLEDMKQAAYLATDGLVFPKIPFGDPSCWTPDCGTFQTNYISCVDFYYTSYHWLLDIFKINDWLLSEFSETFKNQKLGNDTLRAEFKRRNESETKARIYYEIAKMNCGNEINETRRSVSVVASYDPNDKVGSEGHGASKFVTGQEPLRYLVAFENLETATAAAQEVVITDQLDVTNTDLSTFSLGPISFGDTVIIPPFGLSTYTTDVDLRPDDDLIARVAANLDVNTGMIEWRFSSIDPATGFPTTDPLAGFLPPNVNPPEGDGNVLFTVMPKNGLPTGTEIRNAASIVFDTNAPIQTPEWLNTLDNDKPNSSVSPLDSAQSATSFTVEWEGTDVGAGIKDYTIWVSEEGGTFAPWLTNTADTSATFTGGNGATYAFYSIARDQTGNSEPAPTVADTSTTVSIPVVLGDFNGDGCVSRADYSILVADIRSAATENPLHDLNGDGVVNRADARTLVGLFKNLRGVPCN